MMPNIDHGRPSAMPAISVVHSLLLQIRSIARAQQGRLDSTRLWRQNDAGVMLHNKAQREGLTLNLGDDFMAI